MDFFPLPPPPEVIEDSAASGTAPWLGPPEKVLGAAAPLEQVLLRQERLLIALERVVAFPTGVQLLIRIAARRSPEIAPEEWFLLQDTFYGSLHQAEEGPAGSHPDKLLRLGVRYRDGRKATTLDGRYAPTPTGAGTPPAQPALRMQRTGGGSDKDTASLGRDLWLWPLPPPEPFELGWEWPYFDVPLTFAELDGAAIVRAAERCEAYWS